MEQTKNLENFLTMENLTFSDRPQEVKYNSKVFLKKAWVVLSWYLCQGGSSKSGYQPHFHGFWVDIINGNNYYVYVYMYMQHTVHMYGRPIAYYIYCPSFTHIL